MIPDDEQIRALLADHDPRCELVRISRPHSGLVNHLLFLTTTRDNLVLKVFADDVGMWKPHKERAIHDHMRSVGIPAPRIWRVDNSKHVVSFIYSLAERRPGIPLSAVLPALSDVEAAAIYRSLGDYLGKLHATTFDAFGDVAGSADGLMPAPLRELDPDAPGACAGPFATWAEMHCQTVNARVRLLDGTVFEDLIPGVRHFFESHQELIDDAIVPRLLHGDLHPGNVLINNGEVSAVLDVEEAVIGHNEYDLMRTELGTFRGRPPERARAFLDAYERQVPLDEGYDLRKGFYDVSRTLVWMKCLVLYGDNYAKGVESEAHEAARAHLRTLLRNAYSGSR